MERPYISTPGYDTGNFGRQHRGRRGGYGHHQFRNNDSNQHFHRSGYNSFPNNQFNDQVAPLDSSSPIFYHNRGNKMFFRRHQRFSNTGLSGSTNNQRTFKNSSDSSYYQRDTNQFRQKNDKNWHRRLPIAEFIDVKSIFEYPWTELEKDNINAERSDTIVKIDNTSIETVLEKSVVGNTLSDNDSADTSTDRDNSEEYIKMEVL